MVAVRSLAARGAPWCAGDVVWRAWKAFDGDAVQIELRWSDDRGEHWSAPRVIAATSGGLLTADMLGGRLRRAKR
ncbi:hypothetical protein [Burkholderia cepacia]|uniref:hypothetical protein n=1 Tax=Burkholderia cepacia TaxID=292 RepID=UPI0007590949|nr:hypothetical protein [Burkholderia cepacia]KVH30782.1 hypothetical protein WS88_32305 [Burkholderia cepacia]